MTNEVNQEYCIPQPLRPEQFRCAVCVASWNEMITTPLLEGALAAFRQAGVPEANIRVLRVPGSVE